MTKEKKEKVKLDKTEIQNLIQIVATHPTPQGIESREGILKSRLVNKLRQMLEII